MIKKMASALTAPEVGIVIFFWRINLNKVANKRTVAKKYTKYIFGTS